MIEQCQVFLHCLNLYLDPDPRSNMCPLEDNACLSRLKIRVSEFLLFARDPRCTVSHIMDDA